MKRSKMIKLLEQQLKEEHGLDFLGHSPSVVAKDLLDFIESKGMLPPSIEEWQRVDGTFLGEGFEIAVKVNNWENEE